MECDIKFFKLEGIGFLRGKCSSRSRENETAGDLALGIVVSVEQEDGNTGCREPAHLPHEEKPRLVITPVPIIEIHPR